MPYDDNQESAVVENDVATSEEHEEQHNSVGIPPTRPSVSLLGEWHGREGI